MVSLAHTDPHDPTIAFGRTKTKRWSLSVTNLSLLSTISGFSVKTLSDAGV